VAGTAPNPRARGREDFPRRCPGNSSAARRASQAQSLRSGYRSVFVSMSKKNFSTRAMPACVTLDETGCVDPSVKSVGRRNRHYCCPLADQPQSTASLCSFYTSVCLASPLLLSNSVSHRRPTAPPTNYDSFLAGLLSGRTTAGYWPSKFQSTESATRT
jgi:hypothetical protein